MRRRFCLLLLIVLPIILCSLPVPGLAQGGISQAQLNGTVKDEAGGRIPGASVSLRDLETNRTYDTRSNEAGFYVIPNLTPGRYGLKVEGQGFSRYVQTDLM